MTNVLIPDHLIPDPSPDPRSQQVVSVSLKNYFDNPTMLPSKSKQRRCNNLKHWRVAGAGVLRGDLTRRREDAKKNKRDSKIVFLWFFSRLRVFA